MSGKTFVDTNILIYAHDVDAGRKNTIANARLRDLWDSGTGIVSAQVLQEFYVNVTRKIPNPLTKDRAREVIHNYAQWCTETTIGELYSAFRIEDNVKIGFWDALIIASAAKAGADWILSEDLSAGQRIAGVLVENPFANAPRTSKPKASSKPAK